MALLMMTATLTWGTQFNSGANTGMHSVRAEEVDPIELFAVTPSSGFVDALPTEWTITYGGRKLSVKEDAEAILTGGDAAYPLQVMLDEDSR